MLQDKIRDLIRAVVSAAIAAAVAWGSGELNLLEGNAKLMVEAIIFLAIALYNQFRSKTTRSIL